MRFLRLLPLLLSCVVGCGGGGGGDPTIHGIAAAGSPIADATIVVMGVTGDPVTTTTAPDGSFSAPVGGMTGPFLVECDDGAGTVLFSVRPDAGPVNVTPYTDLIISSYYGVHDIALDDAFFDAYPGVLQGTTTPIPTEEEIDAIESVVGSAVALWLQKEGLPATFDLIETPFDADGTGFDAILDMTTFDGNEITITDGETTTTSTVDVSTLGTITVETTTDSKAGSSTSSSSTTIPTSTEGQTDLEGASAAAEAFIAALEAPGGNVTSAHALPFLDNSFLDGGRDRTIFAAEAATFARPVTITSATLTRVISIDDVDHIVALEYALTASAGGQTATELVELIFQKVGSAYLIIGNQRVADPSIEMEARTDSLPSGTTNQTSINVDVSAPTGTVEDSITVSGGPFSSTPLTKSQGTRTEVLEPTPSTTLNYVTDSFFSNSGDIKLPAAGTVFQVTLTPTGGSPVTYDVPGNGVTNEFIAVTSPTGHALANANLNGTLTVVWTLPTTYAVRRVELSGHVKDASGNQIGVEPDEALLGTTATTGHLQFPSSWTDGGGSHTVVEATFNVTIEGTNGERSIVIYSFFDE
jgi:hypothetical protein